ncbi:hypothetical protein [Raoultella terrigena]|uniref:hypothetical protein n=1 Tax=Raoultella terrigena TaxID=577 RepID=UPI0030E01EA1
MGQRLPAQRREAPDVLDKRCADARFRSPEEDEGGGEAQQIDKQQMRRAHISPQD